MALRLIEIYHKTGVAKEIDFLLKDTPAIDMWHDELPEGETITKVLLRSKDTEMVLDILQSFFSLGNKPRVVIVPVEATIPRPDEEAEEKEEEKEAVKSPDRISMEELYQKMLAVAEVSKSYIVMTVLASFVAALGLLKNDVAVIIGSMVISPLLYPSKALALATTLGDLRLAGKALITNIAGFSSVFLVGVLMGIVLDVDPTIPQIAARADVSHFYIFVALATGVAGAYSITRGVVEALVGVMVAVALLPPLVVSGLLFGSQHWIGASGALLLSLVNFVCINLAGVVTFLFQGIRPKEWSEARKAEKSVRIAITAWVVLLLLLALMIIIEQRIMTGIN